MIAESLFGVTPDGRNVYNYTLTDESGQSVIISEYGCAILGINVFGNDGGLYDVALGYDTLAEYVTDTRNFGATIGRYANRIAGGKFTLNGVTYHLPQNDGRNTLHGGPDGFSKRLFSSERKGEAVIFRLESPDLDEGFPGNFTLTVTVSFTAGRLKMDYVYSCDKDTPASITNHSYFNLNGHGTGTILNHKVSLSASKYCRANDELLALAPAVNVEGTPFDFREGRKILDGIISYSPEIIRAGGGYDHCFAVDDNARPCAAAAGDVTGITLEVCSDMPALQFYTGNQIGHVRGKNGAFYNSFDGFALECQKFPNAINEPSFPDCVVKAGQPESKYIEYRFSH
ncbi:MAG: galactose mutarotase [Synergistaceae bacterium]|nr:galactose mutarotase [Synergistaceae bacterium]